MFSAGQIVTSCAPRKQIDLLHGITFFPELSDVEFHLLHLILHKQTDVDKYLIGSSFRDQHQQAFIDHLAIPFVRDAFIACAPLLIERRGIHQLAKAQLTDVSNKRAAAAIASLRQLQVHDDHDLSTVLILGVALVTFATHHGGELLLCRHILGLVKPLYDTGSSYSLTQRLGADGISFLVCLLGTETMDCLIRCEVPTMKVRPGDLDDAVDRFIGISAPLLTYFHELCAVTKKICDSGYRRSDGVVVEVVEKALTEIGDAVTMWEPRVLACSLTDQYTPTEVVLMFAQAKVLRLTALLVLHRLRYAFGTQDGVALAMANAILDELNMVVNLTGQTIPFVDFAYLISCFEITKPWERRAVLEKSHLIVDFSFRWREQIKTWIVSFWAVKDSDAGRSMHWEDIHAYLPDSESPRAHIQRNASH
ncbi:putative Zn(II)2Cys6 transcription factor [Exophiala viscosa]|uniref:putative Zn(II)2Cys6 transcription factor n=1 Tax=Exophiala viscosa TaxID=2486360 RepID=UPI00219153C6|nr:putative Zn(II)2Cys6 transcription factor [Exophiala viscosa]